MGKNDTNRVRAKVEPGSPFFPLIEQAYRVFDYPKPHTTGVCDWCCMDAEIERDFFNPPIADLPLAYVQDWYFAAYDPEAKVPKSTWAYLLPRIFEIMACAEDVANVGLEVTLQRFDTGNPDNWSEKEWQVIDAFQRLYLKLHIERAAPFADQGDHLDDVLCMFGLGGWSVAALGEQVLEASDEALVERLFHDWCHPHGCGTGNIWITAFWDGGRNSEVWKFYTSELLYDRVTRFALDAGTSADLAEKALSVAAIIEASRDE